MHTQSKGVKLRLKCAKSNPRRKPANQTPAENRARSTYCGRASIHLGSIRDRFGIGRAYHPRIISHCGVTLYVMIFKMPKQKSAEKVRRFPIYSRFRPLSRNSCLYNALPGSGRNQGSRPLKVLPVENIRRANAIDRLSRSSKKSYSAFPRGLPLGSQRKCAVGLV